MKKTYFTRGLLAGIVTGILVQGYFLSLYFFKKSFQISEVEIYDIQDRKINFLDTKGKAVVLNFFGRSCPPCIKELPIMAKANKQHSDSVQFYFIVEESKEEMKEFMQRYSYIEYSFSKKPFQEYGILGIPKTYFLNANGNIVDSALGGLDSSTLEMKLTKSFMR